MVEAFLVMACGDLPLNVVPPCCMTPLMCHVACVCYDGVIAVRGCVEEAVSSTLPHRNAFFVVRNVANRGDMQRQQAWRLSAHDADMDLFVDSVHDG